MNRWHTLLAVDFDRWAAETYRANFPGVPVVTGSVADQIATLPDADVVLGGPPCQPHSLAGKRKASADERDGGADFVAAVARVRPRVFLMENVPGLLTSENGAYAAKLLAGLESAGPGYVVQIKTLDAVNFGVPQFRARCWWWGIRSDLYVAGVRHGWPVPTHAWPPPQGAGLFGDVMLPGVTVGEALGLNYGMPTTAKLTYEAKAPAVVRGPSDYVKRQPHGWDHEPMCTLGSQTVPLVAGYTLAMDRSAGLIERSGSVSQSVEVPAYTVRGAAMSGLLLQSHADPAQPIAVPSPTLRSGGAGHDGCCLRLQANTDPVEYRWSDTYRAKHPPASPASSVVGQWHKGLPNGALIVAENWKRKGDLWVRRLAPLECARLQSVPDAFVWPDDIPKTHAYRVVGNGWASGMAAHMSRALAATDPDSRTVVDLYCGGGLGACGWHERFWAYAESGVAA